MHDYFKRQKQTLGVTLNDVQQEAVLHTEGPLLLLASPGSGKTTTVIMRIGYLIQEKHVQPYRIKAVTFSKAAAEDMKERYATFFPGLPPVDFSTIHSLAFEMVRKQFAKEGVAFQIIEGHLDGEATQEGHRALHKKMILRELFQRYAGENITDDQLDELTTHISYLKNKMIPESEWAAVKTDVPHAAKIVSEYEHIKRTGYGERLLDFDDMLVLAEEILAVNETVQKDYQSRYDYVLTDESQDTSLVQHKIIEKLVSHHQNLCVVADDDQSIYSWRGAEPHYLLRFKDVYPTAKILYMEQNYRSSADIVSVANTFIKQNKQRYEKNMFTENPPHEPIAIKHLSSLQGQTTYIVKQLKQQSNLKNIALLYRNNASSTALMNVFDQAGIPFYMKDADHRFFSHWVVQDLLNIMRMTYTDKRLDLYEGVYSKLKGYVSKKQFIELTRVHSRNVSVFDTLLSHVTLHEYQHKHLLECRDTLREMKGMPPKQAISVIRYRLHYEKSVLKMCERLGFRKDYILSILDTLAEIATDLRSMEEFAQRLKHLERVMKQAKFRKGENVVTLSTFHSAKGLEFDHVYMIDLVDGVIPSAEDKKSREGLEEATRLFYVGMTRAKKHLELLSYQEQGGESSFVTYVKELTMPAPKKTRLQGKQEKRIIPPRKSYNPNAIKSRNHLVPGTIVHHRTFGQGQIKDLTIDKLIVRFSAGVKTLAVDTVLEMGILEPVPN
ncbi:UvrD/REP helicase [Fictibacillus macauensis ZFHKF-1]|uniref:DNA 3'-5' helicase n=1 Tax=Fictibacillus macauensis ZFHKF-1 TaxID=1196324 RepID=I8J6D8_9BACL|nr:ATP-dependent helicase [Fictibacillus macauensis]EIT87381.1 UvrD/REP helicase [Fictibacillus macauensis ZFHKF-1]